MKVIDFSLYGNVIKFYLGADDCTDYWGDDWDDAPYEHNAGEVYSRYVKATADVAFPLKYSVCEACCGYFNSPFSKEDMMNRKVPCITVKYGSHLGAEIYFEDNFESVLKSVTDCGGTLLDYVVKEADASSEC